MGMMQEFKEFAMQGNVMDLAVAVIIGGAFQKIVDAVLNGLVSPVIAMLGGQPSVGLKLGVLDIGMVINAVIGFIMVAAVVFFVFVKPAKAMQAKMKKGE